MGELFKRPIVIGVVVAAILIAVVWSYVSNRIEQNKIKDQQKDQAAISITNLTNVEPTEFDQFVVDEYALAKAKAIENNSNNTLSAIVIELPASLGLNSGSDRYIFNSKSDTLNNYVVTLDQLTQNYIRATIPKTDYMGELKEIDTSLWKYNFVTALQLAETNGGKDWRELNTMESASLSLKHADPDDWLVWTIDYNSSNDSFTRKFDANSGKLITD